MLTLDARASSGKDIGASIMEQRRHRARPSDATTTMMMMRRACQHLQKRTSSIPRHPTGRNLRPESLVIGAHGRDEDCLHLQTRASSFHVTRDCQLSLNSRGVALHTEVQLHWSTATTLRLPRCNSWHQWQLHGLPLTSPQLQLFH